MGIARLVLFLTTLAMFLTNTNATRGSVIGPSQAPYSSVSGNPISRGFPGIEEHKSNKSQIGVDVILGGYAMACVVVVLLYIRVTRRTNVVHS